MKLKYLIAHSHKQSTSQRKNKRRYLLMSNSILSVSRDMFQALGHNNYAASPIPVLLQFCPSSWYLRQNHTCPNTYCLLLKAYTIQLNGMNATQYRTFQTRAENALKEAFLCKNDRKCNRKETSNKAKARWCPLLETSSYFWVFEMSVYSNSILDLYSKVGNNSSLMSIMIFSVHIMFPPHFVLIIHQWNMLSIL